MIQLIAESGSTKCEWILLNNGKTKKIATQGINPYFLGIDDIKVIIETVVKKLHHPTINAVHFYGAGLSNVNNQKTIQKALRHFFKPSTIHIHTDIMAACRALLNNKKGIVCILGTGSNTAFYNGKKIVKNSPGLGYVLGDEGSGAYLGKMVLQHYLYKTFDEELMSRFEKTFAVTKDELLQNVYKGESPSRYLASFAKFLTENRGHYMIENIIEDGLNDFFFTHLCKFKEVWHYPVNFTGSIAWAFKDVIKNLCNSYEFEVGQIEQYPSKKLLTYHQTNY